MWWGSVGMVWTWVNHPAQGPRQEKHQHIAGAHIDCNSGASEVLTL